MDALIRVMVGAAALCAASVACAGPVVIDGDPDEPDIGGMAEPATPRQAQRSSIVTRKPDVPEVQQDSRNGQDSFECMLKKSDHSVPTSREDTVFTIAGNDVKDVFKQAEDTRKRAQKNISNSVWCIDDYTTSNYKNDSCSPQLNHVTGRMEFGNIDNDGDVSGVVDLIVAPIHPSTCTTRPTTFNWHGTVDVSLRSSNYYPLERGGGGVAGEYVIQTIQVTDDNNQPVRYDTFFHGGDKLMRQCNETSRDWQYCRVWRRVK